MVLQVFVRRGTPLDRVRYRKATDSRVLVVGSDEFFDYFEAQNGRKRVVVTVAAGDTLGSIGQRYGMSIGSMERVNRRSRRDALHPGERLVVYTKAVGRAAVRSADAGVEPLEATEPPRPDALPPYGEASSRADTPAKTSGG
jgi:LysM repeat protein